MYMDTNQFKKPNVNADHSILTKDNNDKGECPLFCCVGISYILSVLGFYYGMRNL